MTELLGKVLAAAAIVTAACAVIAAVRVVLPARRDRCPACGHPKARDEAGVCVECGTALDRRALARRRLGWTVHAVAWAVATCVLGAVAAISWKGLEAVPDVALVSLADPFADPSTLSRQAYDEMVSRIGRGEIGPSDLTRFMAKGLDRAFDRDDLFILRPAWPQGEPLRISLRRDALNHLRGPNDVRLSFAASSGEFRQVAGWGNPSGRPPSMLPSAWAERSIEVPTSCNTATGVAFDAVVLDREDRVLWRKGIELACDWTDDPNDVLPAVEREELWSQLRDGMRILVSPLEREGHPHGALAISFAPPIPALDRELAVGLAVTVESLDVPGLRAEGRVLVRANARAASPSPIAPLCLEHPDQPRRWGRCRIRLDADQSMALRDLTKTKWLVGGIEFERTLDDAPRAAGEAAPTVN